MTNEKTYVDLGVTLPQRKSKVTTAIEIALFKNGVEIKVPGYRRHQLNHMRTMFMPSTGEILFELQGANFGEVIADHLPIEIDSLIMHARDAAFAMRRFEFQFVRSKLEIMRVPWMKVPMVQV